MNDKITRREAITGIAAAAGAAVFSLHENVFAASSEEGAAPAFRGINIKSN